MLGFTTSESVYLLIGLVFNGKLL